MIYTLFENHWISVPLLGVEIEEELKKNYSIIRAGYINVFRSVCVYSQLMKNEDYMGEFGGIKEKNI